MKKTLKILIIALFLIISSIIATKVLAQEDSQEDPNEVAQKYGITFPISELGGCKDYTSCRTYCEDPVNQPTCISYAKQKGFYKDSLEEKRDEILQAAKNTLGCDSVSSCQTFCSDPQNQDKCDSFAKRHNVVGGHVNNPGESKIMEKAKETLGCDSAQSCSNFCSDPANRQKCSEFARQTGLRGGEQKVGPGGCTSEATCRTFCSDPSNYQVCAGFSQTAGARFSGPGGCNSEESCRDFCKNNPDRCRVIGATGGMGGDEAYKDFCKEFPEKCKEGEGGTPSRDFEKFCLQNPDKCRPPDGEFGRGGYNPEETQKKADEYAKYCRENPDKCKPGESGGFQTAEQRKEFENYCTKYPERCQPSGGSYSGSGQNYTPHPYNNYQSSDPATECARTSGCSWNGSSCQCSGSSGSGSYSPPPYTQPSYTQPVSQPPSGESVPPPPSDSGGYQPPPGEVHGIYVVRSLIQQLIDYLFGQE